MERKLGKARLAEYFFSSSALGAQKILEIKGLGSGVHGEGYLVRAQKDGAVREYVIKSIRREGLGHDYPSDRAAVLLLALDTYNALPGHVRAIDVLSRMPDGSLRPVGGGTEYYLLMQRALGTSYFQDLETMAEKAALGKEDRAKITMMADYLAGIHGRKKASRGLYLRKLRDIIGHGECLMGVFDTYPRGTLHPREMAAIEKKCIDWRMRLKSGYRRLCLVHGDFHPGNIWFYEEGENNKKFDFVLLDRSRGPWGEAADDLTALSINYVFFSVKRHNEVKGPYLEAIKLFFRRYIEKTGDEDVLDFTAPFFAFRGAVVANPVFYPELKSHQRTLIFRFVNSVLDSPRFDPARANDYLGS
ncbi:MAG: hypothetical protein M0Z59_06360 [Nitrospiraceae bacterium]|nr:hypothetical protein [Nitrospiraceae bacterium]